MSRLLLILILIVVCNFRSFAQDDQNKTKPVQLQVDKKVWSKVKNVLNGVDGRYYKLRYGSGSNAIDSLGSAEINRLEPVSVISARSSSIGTVNIIQVLSAKGISGKPLEYIILYWAADASTDIPDKVAQVNALLKNN